MTTSRGNTRKSYGGSIQTNLEIQKNILRKLQANLKWKNVRQFTHEQRTQLPQRVANQQKIVNELQKMAATTQQNKGILASITNKINNAVNRTNQALQQPSPAAAQQAVAAANQAAVAANAVVNQTQNIKKMAMNANTLAKNANTLAKRIKSMSGGKRKTRRN
jgi:phage gpG-like protein